MSAPVEVRKMMRNVPALLLACATLLLPTLAVADQTGMASMHSWTKVGGRTCMSDHYHYGGTSGTKSTKKAALSDAIASWQSFTDFEYGSDWASFNLATGKQVDCSESSSGWSCQIEARPCLGKSRR
ncbi:MAG: hypothetical protein NW205_12240 [Hyphomicrobiaceae bacterium]|nr:hypothetical protein [Hyphomicrobiaceae bacterium]